MCCATLPLVTLGTAYYELLGILYGQAFTNTLFALIALLLTTNLIAKVEKRETKSDPLQILKGDS